MSAYDKDRELARLSAQRNRIAAYQWEIDKLRARGRNEDAPRIIKLRRMIARFEREMRQGVLIKA